ncbi:fimbrillin family protein [uncultured Bacteroides sp.]|jgi:hypothetical protein|uniref:fimbrillin family protein n=1 Tax=uncultured Bacteroides sp. TaxID=162156 RepID=UPI00280C0C40|nr:fimbrillin family protein [uncultured Bacteroides sp.]
MKFKLLLAASTALLWAACSSEEGEPGIQDADAIPFTASIQPETRLTTNNSWVGLSDDKVAVSIDGMVKEYAVNETGELTSPVPFCWEGRTDVSVDAWYPYNGGVKPEVIVSSDQSVSANYLKSDFLEVSGATVTFENAVLAFVHRTTKIVCTLNVPDGGTNGSQVILHGLAGVDKGNSVVTTSDYRALLAPQTVAAGVDFIEVIMSDKRTYTYKLSEDLVLQQGHICQIDLFFTPTGLDAIISDSSMWAGDTDDVGGSSSVNTPEAGGGVWSGDTSVSVDGTADSNTAGTEGGAWNGETGEVTGSEVTGNITGADTSGQWKGDTSPVIAKEKPAAN